MKILVLCDQGNNRSVTIAHQLKYWGHDVLSAGLTTNTSYTLMMLNAWADRIIVTAENQLSIMRGDYALNQDDVLAKVQLWDIGPDVYPRPFNPELLAIVKELMQEHRAEYKQN